MVYNNSNTNSKLLNSIFVKLFFVIIHHVTTQDTLTYQSSWSSWSWSWFLNTCHMCKLYI